MARPRQTIDVLLYKEKKGLTKAAAEQRKVRKVNDANNKVKLIATYRKT
ncbi:hypothetical protein C2W64_01615 [Brevibacillus laterosporus]|nr:hypothetical protein [Brevibacillus laterosporus]RAP30419.1 hypothetical protein C2W64_01615 [Brevibacillus laterosporus]